MSSMPPLQWQPHLVEEAGVRDAAPQVATEVDVPLAHQTPNVETRTAAENLSDRRRGSQWLTTPGRAAFNNLVIIRCTMQPLVDLLN